MAIKRTWDLPGLPYAFRRALSFMLWGYGTEAPTNGATGRGSAEPGSAYVDYKNGVRYVNANTKASPQWSRGGLALGQDANGLPAMVFVGAATDDAGIVTQVGADALWADGSLYLSVVDGAGKVFQKQNDVWVDLQA